MTLTSKIIGAALVLAAGTAAYLLSQDDQTEALSAPLAGSEATELGQARAQELATPAPEKEAAPVEPRTALQKPVEETRETKRARQQARGPWLKGRILDPYGNPIKNAIVEVNSWQAAAQGMMLAGMSGGSGAPKEDSRHSVMTDEDGRFAAFRRDKLGLDVSISMAARGFLVSKERELLGDEGTLELGDYTLEPGVVIRGIVLDAGGQPVAEASVKRADGEGGGMFEFAGAMLDEFGMGAFNGGHRTDESGQFELPYEEPGTFKLVVAHKDHPETHYEGETPAAGSETPNIIINMKAGATLSGTLTGLPENREKVHVYARLLDAAEEEDADLLEMLGEASMMAAGHSCLVEPGGKFTINGLQPDKRYELRAIEKGGMFMRKPCSEMVRATAGDLNVELVFDTGASLAFQVVDSTTGDPITQLEIKHSWVDGSDMFSAMASAFGGSDQEVYPEGRVLITELRPKDDPSTLRVRVTSEGYLDYEREDILIPMDGDVEIGTIRLKLAPRVRVHVVDARTGKPVSRARVRMRNGSGGLAGAMRDMGSGAEVNIEIGSGSDMQDFFDSKTISGKTDSEGWVDLPAFEMDQGVLTVRSPKYSDFEKVGIHVNATGTKTLDAALIRGGEVHVEVRDGANQPVPGAVVRHRNSDGKVVDSKSTNRKGLVRFRRLAPGPHSFMAEHETGNIRGMFGSVNFSSGDDDEDEAEDVWMNVAVVDGETSRVKLTAPGFGTLEGSVTANGLPLVGATVSLSESEDGEDALSRFGGAFGEMLSNGGLSDVTNEKGEYKISSVPAGEYSFVVRHPDHAMSSVLEVELSEGENRFDGRLLLASLEGRIEDSNGDAVAGAKLSVEQGTSNQDFMDAQGILEGPMAGFLGGGDDSGARSRADGTFVIHGVRDDEPVFVVARKSGYVSARSESVTVKKGDLKGGLDIVLVRAGSALVRVPSETDPFTMIQASYTGETKEGEAVAAKFAFVRNGKATLKDLREGTWRVEFSNQEDEATAQEITVVAGEQVETTLVGP